MRAFKTYYEERLYLSESELNEIKKKPYRVLNNEQFEVERLKMSEEDC